MLVFSLGKARRDSPPHHGNDIAFINPLSPSMTGEETQILAELFEIKITCSDDRLQSVTANPW